MRRRARATACWPRSSRRRMAATNSGPGSSRRSRDRSNKVLGVFRICRALGARIIPVDKKARHELQVQKGDENGALNGELVEAEITRDRGHGLPIGPGARTAGRYDRPAQYLAHRHSSPRHSQPVPGKVIAESEALKPFARDRRSDLRDVPLLTIDPPRCPRP